MPETDLGGIKSISGEELVSTTSYVKWEGRYEYVTNQDTGDMVYLYHTATGFTVDFIGTELEVDFYHTKKDLYFNVSVDGEPMPNTNENRTFFLSKDQTESTVKLVSGLKNKRHTLTCLKMSEAPDGYSAVKAIRTNGKLIERNFEDDNSRFKFMFVCASGGSGHGSLSIGSSSGGVPRTTKNSSSLHSFNYLTARQFDADVQYVSTSGWGVKYPKSIYEVFDYTGITPSNSVSGAKTTALWNHQSWIPDVIIFNIGGNDTTANGFDANVYKQTVVSLVNKLHTLYPGARMIWTHTNSNAGKYAIAALTDADIMSKNWIIESIIPKVGQGETGIGTYGANNHNSIKTHIDTAKILADDLANTWGYVKVKDNIVYEDYSHLVSKP